MRAMAETPDSVKSNDLVAVVLRDRHGRVMVLRTAGLPEFVLPFGSITPGTPAAENPALAARLIAHEAVRVDIDESRLRRLGTYCSPAANRAGNQICAHAYVYEEELSVAHPDKDIAELAWVDPAQPDVTVAPLLNDQVFPAL